jgi:hypothetical protein
MYIILLCILYIIYIILYYIILYYIIHVIIVSEKNGRCYFRTAARTCRVHEDIKITMAPAAALEVEMSIGVSIACIEQLPGELF